MPKGLLINGEIVVDGQKMANFFNEYFTSIGQDLANMLPPGPPPFILYEPPDIPIFKFPSVTTEFVLKQLQSMPENKVVGLEKLPGKLLRAAAPIIAQPLACILNLSLQSGKFISEWKYAKVLPLHKSGSKMERNNFTPNSIFPILSKVLERFVHTNFPQYLEHYKLISIAN